MNKIYASLLLLLSTHFANGQEFKFEAKLDSIPSSGYCELPLKPEVSSQLQDHCGDLRIYDTEGVEVPYLLEKEQWSVRSSAFEEFKIIEKNYNSSWRWESVYIVEATTKDLIDRLYLSIANFEARKRLRLSGSDDKDQWYIIKDGYTIYGAQNDTSSATIKVLRFPKSNYQFYKIEVDDFWEKDPIDVKSAGYYTTKKIEGELTEVPSISIYVGDSAETKRTVINIDMGGNQFLDRVTLNFADTGNYYRKAHLRKQFWTSDTTWDFRTIQTKWLSSTSLNEFQFPTQRTERLRIEIENKDDRPLDLQGCVLEQLSMKLICALDSNSTYLLKFGSDSSYVPEYDLKYFREDLPAQMPQVSITDITKVDLVSPVAEELRLFENPTVLWSVIGLVIVLLGYIALRMLSDKSPKA